MCEYQYIKDQLDEIYDYYGEENQQLKLIEEMGELISAMARDDYDNYIEELADVSIVLEQIIINLNKNRKKQFEEIRIAKIEKTLKNIKNEKDEQIRTCSIVEQVMGGSFLNE